VAAPNPTRQKAAREGLGRLFVHPSSVFVIHYACESFNEAQGYASPRITAEMFPASLTSTLPVSESGPRAIRKDLR